MSVKFCTSQPQHSDNWQLKHTTVLQVTEKYKQENLTKTTNTIRTAAPSYSHWDRNTTNNLQTLWGPQTRSSSAPTNMETAQMTSSAFIWYVRQDLLSNKSKENLNCWSAEQPEWEHITLPKVPEWFSSGIYIWSCSCFWNAVDWDWLIKGCNQL